MAYGLDNTTTTTSGPTTYPPLNHRQSLPILQTRTAYPESYDSYSASPVDGYPYSSYGGQRNDSVNGSYENGYRSWSNVSMLLPASATNVYEQSPGYTFGSISAPSFLAAQTQPQQQTSRLPSVSADHFSSLNMGNLYTSLPTQTVQSRRLPIPPTAPFYESAPYSGPELPEIRPLAEPRTRLNSVHNRIAASWGGDFGFSGSRNGSSSSLAQQNGTSLQPIQTTSMMQEPVVGYHYNTTSEALALPATQSPSLSPTAGPSTSASYSNAQIFPMSMTPVSCGSYYGLPPITTTYRSESNASRSLQVPPTTSYSFASEPTTATSSDRDSSDTGSSVTYASYPSIRHPQPQHAASVDALRRQASFDQQQQQHQRAGPTQRISVSDLSNGGPAYSTS